MEEDILKESSERVSLGVGIRVIHGEKTGYAYTNDLTLEKMRHATLTAAAVARSGGSKKSAPLVVSPHSRQVYDLTSPLAETALKEKVDLVQRAYASAMDYDERIVKVQATLGDELQTVLIANSEGLLVSDTRPQMRLMVIATATENGTFDTGLHSGGGRVGMRFFENDTPPERIGEKAAEEAVTLLSAVDPQPGDQPVVLGCEQSGVMIHEAVGHPLEADGNRKKTSIMWDKMGKQVAAPIVTIVDDPTIPRYRGSMNIDDEGTVTKKTPLIENGRLVGLLQDRLSARLMNAEPNGHGRRDSYQSYPVPRMTNTILLRGESDPEDIIASVKKGFYAKSYQGGQVQDSGKFTFSINLGYRIENGRLTVPVKNATLIGTNLQILNDVEMIGNDMGFFLGTCGKEGQSAPVTAGTPTLKIRKMTVGGRQ